MDRCYADQTEVQLGSNASMYILVLKTRRLYSPTTAQLGSAQDTKTHVRIAPIESKTSMHGRTSRLVKILVYLNASFERVQVQSVPVCFAYSLSKSAHA